MTKIRCKCGQDFKVLDDSSESELIDTNSKGGRQSKITEALSLLPPLAQLEKARVLAEGAKKYGINNWKLISRDDHLNHALRHIFLYISGDTSENHLVNAACRMDFALETKGGECFRIIGVSDAPNHSDKGNMVKRMPPEMLKDLKETINK